MKSVTVEQEHLEEGIIDGLMTFMCPYCGNTVKAEPDADMVCCQVCDNKIKVINNLF